MKNKPTVIKNTRIAVVREFLIQAGLEFGIDVERRTMEEVRAAIGK